LTLTEEARFLSMPLRSGAKDVEDVGNLIVLLVSASTN
jgi:hypothetical protein